MSWTFAGAAVGAGVGSLAGGVGAGPGAQIGATIGSLIDAFTQRSPVSLADRRYSSCSYGTPINRVWGSTRVDCALVWVGRNSDGTYMHEVDEFKKSGTEQHWFATFALLVAETGFTFPDGTQQERPLTVDMIWMADDIVWTNPATVSTIPNWSSVTTYNFGDIVKASDGRYYSSLADANVNLNPAAFAHPNWWQVISFVDQSIDFAIHPDPGTESTFTMAADATISGWAGGSYVSAMRGTTNLVVSNMDCYNIGNAIPQNSSVSCHTDPVTDADVLTDLCRMCGVPPSFLAFGAMNRSCTGYAISNRLSGKDALTNYCIAKSIVLAEVDGMLTAYYKGGESVATIPDADTGASLDGKKVEDRLPVEVLADLRQLHSSIAVRYRSASQWYRQVDILSLRNDALAENQWAFDTGLVLEDDEAVQMASMLLDVEWLEAGGKFGPLKLPDTYAYLAPGCPITADDNGRATRFRVTEMDWVPGLVTLMLARDEIEVLNQYGTGDSGLPPILPQSAPIAGFVIASPAEDATSHLATFPGFYVWLNCFPRSALCTVWYSFDNFATAAINGGSFYQKSVFGLTATTALANATAPGYEAVSDTFFTYQSSRTMSGVLVDTTQNNVQNGAQWALIGNEWVGIVDVGSPGSTQQIGPGLIRGLRGSPYTGHAIGEQFAACSIASLLKIQADPQYIGQTVYVQVLTPGQQLGDSVVLNCLIQGPTSLTPVNPSAVSAGAPAYAGANETVTFTATLPSVPPPTQVYNWQYSTNAGTTWSASTIGGLVFTPPSFSAGTMMVRAQPLLSDGIVGAWVDSADITYAAPAQNFQEVPTGAVDGSNNTFVLSHTPISGTLNFYVNGLLVTGWVLTGASVALATAPAVSSTVYATYTY